MDRQSHQPGRPSRSRITRNVRQRIYGRYWISAGVVIGIAGFLAIIAMQRHPQYGSNPPLIALGCSLITGFVARRFVHRAFFFVEHGIDVTAFAVRVIPGSQRTPRQVAFEYQFKGNRVEFLVTDQLARLKIGDSKELLVDPNDPMQWVLKSDFIDPTDYEV